MCPFSGRQSGLQMSSTEDTYELLVVSIILTILGYYCKILPTTRDISCSMFHRAALSYPSIPEFLAAALSVGNISSLVNPPFLFLKLYL